MRVTKVVAFALILLCQCLAARRAHAQGQICAFSGRPQNIPKKANGDLDFKALGSPHFIRIVGSGGGGGGAGAGRSTDNGYGPSGSGGAGADIVAYLYGPIDASTALRVTLTDDGAGGCGGVTDHAHCNGVPDIPTARARNEGEPGHRGVTVRIANMVFEGGDGGATIQGWKWPAPASGVARGGQLAFRGGNGGTFGVRDPMPGSDMGPHHGGKIGPRPTDGKGFGGIPGAGGGASRVGDGGSGGLAGSGDGHLSGADNNAGDGQPGEFGAGGGGGGGAAGGSFPGKRREWRAGVDHYLQPQESCGRSRSAAGGAVPW